MSRAYSRRRFLVEGGHALGLGGALLGAGCEPAQLGSLAEALGLPRTEAWTAAFAGTSPERGHLLRSTLPASVDETQATDVLVLGGGIAGLAAARALRRAGVSDYRILELEDEPGGNSRAGAIRGLECPFGAHYLPLPGAEAADVADLLTELGLRRVEHGRATYDELHLCHRPQERLFIDGQWQEGVLPLAGQGAATLAEYRRFSDAIEDLRRRRLFAIPTAAARWRPELDALDAQTFEAWLEARGFASPGLLWYLDYCCRDDYGAGLSRVSAWAGLHYFASRQGFRLPGTAIEANDEVLTWPEGNAWLARRLAAPHREATRTGVLVLRVEEGRREVSVHTLEVATGRHVRWQARHAILAMPVFVAARVVASPSCALAAVAARMEYAPWLVANLYVEPALDDRRGQAPASWDNVVYGSRGLGYVDATHQLTRSFRGPTVLTYYRALGDEAGAERRRLLEGDAVAWGEAALADIEVAHPDLRSKVRQVEVVRYGHGMATPTPGLRSDPALAALRESGGRLRYAHSDLSAYSAFEEAFHWGTRAGAATGAALRKA